MRKRDSLLSEAQHLQSRNGYQPETRDGQRRRGPVPLYATVYGHDWWIWWSMITDQISISLSSVLFFFFYLISLKCFILMPLLGRAAAADDGNGKMMPKMVMEMKRWWFYLPEKLTIRHNQGWKQFVKNDCFLSNRNPKSLGHSYVNNKWFHRM